jgi:transcriptional regulator with XRE-family HTH domain
MKNAIHPDTIKNNIKKHLSNRGWSQADLEKKTGNNRNISNILRGVSKYPTIEVLQRIANAFNIEVTQLLADNNKQYETINRELLVECFTKVLSNITPLEREYTITIENIFTLVNEVYNYSKKLNIDTVDEKFVEWVISKYY